MALGTHRWWRVTVDSMSSSGTWNLRNVIPLIGDELLPDAIYGLDSNSGIPINVRSTLDIVGYTNVTKDASISSTNWGNITRGLTGLSSSWGTTTVPQWGSLEFSDPVELPLWCIYAQYTGNVVDGLSFHYSDNGSDWTLARSFSGTLFTNAGFMVFVLDEARLRHHMQYRQDLLVSSRLDGGIVFRQRCEDFMELRGFTVRSTLNNNPADQRKASLGDIEWRLSGGLSNENPADSLGGAMALKSIASQVATVMDTIPGVTVVAASNNTRGIGTVDLFIDSSGRKWLDWTPSGELTGGAVHIPYDGRFTLFSGRGTANGYLSVDADLSALQDSAGQWRIYIENGDQLLFSDVQEADANAGLTTYRCLYLHNNSATGKLRDLFIYMGQDTISPTDIEIGLDPSGVTYGTGAVTIVDEETAPAGVAFSQPTADSPLEVGDIIWQRNVPLWIKRVIPANTYESVQHDLSVIVYGVTF